VLRLSMDLTIRLRLCCHRIGMLERKMMTTMMIWLHPLTCAGDLTNSRILRGGESPVEPR
jgi:hypothetical protein